MTLLARARRTDRRPQPRRPVRLLPLAALAACGVLQAQTSGTTIVPTFSTSLTLTDNRHQRATEKQGDAIMQISPGIAISSRSGAVQGFLNYAGTGILYARDSGANNFQNSLAARGSAELIDRRLVVDATASISQQAISAFGTQSVDPALNDSNRTEVRSYSIAPYLRGRLLGEVDYQARLSYAASRSSGRTVGDSSALAASLGLGGGTGLLGWGFDAQRTIAESDINRQGRTMFGLLRASLVYRPSPDLQFSARAGREANNVVTTRSTNTWGGSATWLPGPRTQASLSYDRRFFGNSHSIVFSHRFARSIWSFSDSRELNTGGTSGASSISLYELYFQLFASLEPNPALREQRVREFLRVNGLDPAARVSSGFLSAGNSVQRRQSLSFAIQGVRNTFSASAFAGSTTRLGSTLAGSGDLALVDTVRQTGLTMAWSYRLTPRASLGLSGSMQRTDNSGSLAGNELRSLSAVWSSTLGPYSNVSLAVRHSASDGESNRYTESAITGSLSMRF